MGFDGADGQGSDLGDVSQLELLNKAEQEDGALPFGQRGDGLPDQRKLLLGDERRLRRAGWMWKVRGEVVER